MYINALYLPLFNFAYLFFLSFLSFLSSQHICQFYFIALFPNWHRALVLFFSLCFIYFCSGRYYFWFPLFPGSIYCTLFLLDCFDFAYGYICTCVYSVTLFIVINLCLYVGFQQFCGVFLFFFSFFFLPFSFFSLLYNFNSYFF